MIKGLFVFESRASLGYSLNLLQKFKKIKKTSIYDIPWYVTDNSNVKKIYGWKPKKSLEKIVFDIFNWLKKDKKNLIKYF